MNVLAIDSSTKHFSLAVSCGARIVKRRSFVLKKVLSSSIIPAIDRILKDARLTLKDIDVLVVGRGPGSFTSLRVGLSTIKGLAFAAGKPVIGIPSLDAVALRTAKYYPAMTQILVLSDAKRQLVYTALYTMQDAKLCQKSEYALISAVQAIGQIKTNAVLTGDGISVYHKDIQALGKTSHKIIVAKEALWYPRAEDLITLAQKRMLNTEYDDLNTLIPMYLYPDDCQVQK